MIRALATLALSCGLVSCSKPLPLTGTFTGDSHIKTFGPAVTRTDAKGSVVFTTERRNRGGIDGQFYVMTLDGPPFTGPCKLTSLLPAEDGADPLFGKEGNSCKASVDGKQVVASLGGNAKLENGVLTVLVISGDLEYAFTGKR